MEVDDTARAAIDELVATLPHRPSFTLLLPVEGADAELVRATIGSVADQRYPDWALFLTGGESPDAAVVNEVTAKRDSRVRFTGPSPAPSGEWVIRLAPGDLLNEAALFAVANAVVRHPGAAVVYTDHDHVGPEGRFVDPHMKPDWNPDLLAGMDYFGIVTAYRADLWEAHATVSSGAHELAVRATASLEANQGVHVPHVLAARRGPGDRSHLVPATGRVVHPLPSPPPRVSVLIPTKDRGRMLERCLSRLRENTTYPDLELVVVDHETTEVRARAVLDSLAGMENVQIIPFSGPFNFSTMCNRAAEASSGDVLVLLNNDTEAIQPGWLFELVAQVSRPEVGVVGALLTFSDGTIQHAGVHPGLGGLMGHGHKPFPGDHPGYFGRLLVPHEVAAVTGASLGITRELWGRLGGLDEEHLAVAYSDIDLCLRARAAGLRVVLAPHAVVRHHESVSRGYDNDPIGRARLEREAATMEDRWGDMLHTDPAHSTNLALDGDFFSPALKPRVAPPWRN